MKEVWKDCTDLEGRYEVSNLGDIRNKKTKKLRKIVYGKRTKKGQTGGIITIKVNSKIKAFKIHRLIAETFIPNPQNKSTVNHIDGNKTNNKISNLEWSTQSENIKHAWDKRLNNGARNWNDDDLQKIYKGFEAGFTAQELAKSFKVDASSISDLIRGKTYKHTNLNFSKFNKSYYTDIARNNIKKIKELKQNGLNSEVIGNIYNVSGRIIRKLLR